MIHFFRRLRKTMLKQERLGQYLLYAIGEIVLVMIGILLALQVNNWNIDRINKKQEVALLVQLEKEFEENLNEVNEKNRMRQTIRNSIKEIFNYVDQGIKDVPLDSINKHIGNTFYLPTYDGPNGVIQEILNSGKLYLIANKELKLHLTNWENTKQKVIEEEQLMIDQHSIFYSEYLKHNYNIRKMNSFNVIDEKITVFKLYDESKIDHYKVPGTHDAAEYKKYLNDKVISNYLISINTNCNTASIQAMGLKQKIEQILKIIRNELKE